METPRVEWRMYGFVPYQLSGIQKGIQFGHAVVEYLNQFGDYDNTKTWRERDKTFVILNGGTFGDMRFLMDHLCSERLSSTFLDVARFNEPSMNHALTGIAFLVPSTIYNYDLQNDLLRDATAITAGNRAACQWLQSFKLA